MQALIQRVEEAELAAFESLLLELYGLSFTQARGKDIDRILSMTLVDTGHECGWDLIDAVRTQGSEGPAAQQLVRNATVGESYFFRHASQMAALRDRILPELIRRRSKDGKRLRIWSAGCSSGEELYSVAILLRELIPDPGEWCITLLGTDVCSERIEKARRGVYGVWSFRDTPAGVTNTYFQERERSMELIREIRSMATFQHLNLASDEFPSLKTNTFCMDLVLARNVLMYLDPIVARQVSSRLVQCLARDGVALFGPSDAPNLTATDLVRRNANGVAYYVRSPEPPDIGIGAMLSPDRPGPLIAAALTWSAPGMESQITVAQRCEAVSTPTPLMTVALRETAPHLARTLTEIKQLADGGDFEAALAACESNADVLRFLPDYHLLAALIRFETGELEEALEALDRTLFLDESCVFAQVLKAICHRRLGRAAAARRWCRNAIRNLERISDDELVSGLDRIFAGDCKLLLSGLFEGQTSHA
jgi:chemotaxis protein methyltransferase CheR